MNARPKIFHLCPNSNRLPCLLPVSQSHSPSLRSTIIPRREAEPVRQCLWVRSRSLPIMNLEMRTRLVGPGISPTTQTTMLAIRDPYRGLGTCGLSHNWCGHLDLCLFIFCYMNGTRVSYGELEFSSGYRCSNYVIVIQSI